MNDNLNIARFNQLLTVSNPTIVKKSKKIYPNRYDGIVYIQPRK